MNYRITIKLRQQPYYYPFTIQSRESVVSHLLSHLGQAGRLVSVAEQLDQLAVDYDLGGDNQFDSHHALLQRMEWAAGQLAIQAVEAEVAELVRYGVEAGAVTGLTALGATAKQKPEIAIFAALVGALGGFLAAQFLPQPRVILRAARHPYGWVWTEVPRPQLIWSPATT